MISIVGTRVAAAMTLLVLLAVLQFLLGDGPFSIVVAVSLVVAIVVQLTAVVFFGQRAVEPDAPFTLRIRVQDATLLLIGSMALAVLGVIVVLRALVIIPPVDRWVFLLGISFGALMLAGPAMNALVIWRPWRKV